MRKIYIKYIIFKTLIIADGPVQKPNWWAGSGTRAVGCTLFRRKPYPEHFISGRLQHQRLECFFCDWNVVLRFTEETVTIERQIPTLEPVAFQSLTQQLLYGGRRLWCLARNKSSKCSESGLSQ